MVISNTCNKQINYQKGLINNKYLLLWISLITVIMDLSYNNKKDIGLVKHVLTRVTLTYRNISF
jgi:hypothetical protein